MGGKSADIHCTAKLARRTQRPLEYVHFSTFSSTNLNAPGGFRVIYRDEGWRGLYRGTTLVLVGMSNGALQFMAYEKMKSWAFERKRPWFAKLGREWIMQDDKLVRRALLTQQRKLTQDSFHVQSNTASMLMSGASKLAALCTTYPYQVICSSV